MNVEDRDDDRANLTWVAGHSDGYVINIQRSVNPADARQHHANCRTISGQNPGCGPWTGSYVKFCSLDMRELEGWAIEHAGGPIARCESATPGPRAAVGSATSTTPKAPSTSPRPATANPAGGSRPVSRAADRRSDARERSIGVP